MPKFLARVDEAMNRIGSVGAIVFECTELPGYANETRLHTGLPVFDSLTMI